MAHLRKDAKEAGLSLKPLFRALDARRSRAHEQVRATLEADDYPGLLDALVEAIASPPLGPGAGALADTALPELVQDAWRRLKQRADDLGPDTPDADFHRARIAAKRARYASELAGRVLSEQARGRRERAGGEGLRASGCARRGPGRRGCRRGDPREPARTEGHQHATHSRPGAWWSASCFAPLGRERPSSTCGRRCASDAGVSG